MDFRILGPLEVHAQGRSLPLGGTKQRALLAVLLMHVNEVVAIERLVGALWDGDPPDRAADTIRVYISHLRKILSAGRPSDAADVLTSRSPGYVLALEPHQSDLGRFERLRSEGRDALEANDLAVASVKLREALALWRGPALVDFNDEPFAREWIDRLEQERLRALEDRVEADLGLGRHAEILPELEQFSKEYPLRERLRGQLMLSLYRSGREGEALRAFDEASAALREELGSEPGPPLWELRDAIQNRDPSLLLPPAEVARAAPDLHREPIPDVEPVLPLPSGEAGLSEGEVANVAALFGDIVGSTALGERLSPEEVRAVVGECVSRMSRVVEEYGGIVQAYMGDGIAALFGLPAPHEDDAVRAARAGLRVIQVVGEYAEELGRAWGIHDFNVRVGINAGRVAVGTIGAGDPQVAVFGDPMNVAARLQTSAEPGTIRVGDAAARQLAPEFVLEPLGELHVKGREGSVVAWRLVGMEASRPPPAATPLVDRALELTTLGRAVEELTAGRGQIALIGGDAGIGKTRLVGELRATTASEVLWLEGRCLSYGEQHRYPPFVEALEGWLGVGEGDPDLVARTKLHARLGALMGDAGHELLPYLARLLSVRLDPDGEKALAGLSPDDLASGTRRAYRMWLESLCARQAVVLVIEDVHAADPLTRALAEDVLSLTDAAPLLLLITGRHVPASEGWQLEMRVLSDFRHRSLQMELAPLSESDARQLLDALSPTGSIDEASKEQIVARAEGNPLYLEELLRSLVQSGGLERGRGWTLSMTRAGLVLPPALESLLMVRIQNLAPRTRRLAQIAAVIGREFAVALLERLTSEEEVQERLPVLLRSEVFTEVRRYPQLVCMFRHGLMQQAALASLAPGHARKLYGAVARAYEEMFADTLEDRLDAIAFYYYRSGEPAKALDYLERAAERASAVDGEARGAELWDRARRLASRLGDAEAERRASDELARLGHGSDE